MLVRSSSMPCGRVVSVGEWRHIMRIVDIREVLTADVPKKANKAHVEAIVGRTLGEVTVADLMQASYAAKSDGFAAEATATPLREVYLEAEEE